jgi:hypothetical protein
MNQDNKVVMMAHMKNKNKMSDRDRVVYAHHYFQNGNTDGAMKLLGDVHSLYYQSQMYKDISRALLCHATYKTTNDPGLGKESEFYLIIYYLTRHITENKLHFTGSGHFYQMRDELFKGFSQEWR